MSIGTIIVIQALICAVIAALIAAHKGHSPAAFFLFGLTIGVFGILLACFMDDETIPGRPVGARNRITDIAARKDAH